MELLAPAGNLEKLKTAVLYGANAVYLAGQKFSLRGASENFSDTELIEGVKFAKDKKCKIYVPSEEEKLTHILEDVSDKLIHKNIFSFEWGRQVESNHRPHHYQWCALPLSYGGI